MNRTSFTIMLILISALIIDTITSNIYDFISKEVDSGWGLTFFISVSSTILVVGLILLLGPLKKQSEHLRTTNSAFNKMYKLTVVVQFLIIAIFLFTVIQMVSTSQYFTPLLIIPSVVGPIPFYISLGLLACRFFSWYRSSRQNTIVFLYGLAIAFMLIGNAVLDTGVAGVFLNAPLMKKSSSVQFQDDLSIDNPSHLTTELSGNLLNAAVILLIISFLFLWVVSAVLLYRVLSQIRKIHCLLDGYLSSSSFCPDRAVTYIDWNPKW